MKKRTALLTLICLFLSVMAVYQLQAVSVTASVVSGSGAIQAVLQPGEFTISAGKKAVNLRVQKDTILMGNRNSSKTRSDKDIYCVTTGQYIPASQAELPAGSYKFVVGGGPGSVGTLSYDLVSA